MRPAKAVAVRNAGALRFRASTMHTAGPTHAFGIRAEPKPSAVIKSPRWALGQYVGTQALGLEMRRRLGRWRRVRLSNSSSPILVKIRLSAASSPAIDGGVGRSDGSQRPDCTVIFHGVSVRNGQNASVRPSRSASFDPAATRAGQWWNRSRHRTEVGGVPWRQRPQLLGEAFACIITRHANSGLA